MNIVCVICSDLLTPSADVFHTPCGHIFHYSCLNQWLQRSKSCPQCREKTTSHKIHRIYFNFSNNDTIVEDSCSLQEKVDKLSLELSLREKDSKHFSEKCHALENETMILKKELLKMDTEKSSIIGALKLQLNYFKEQALETDSMKKENEQLKGRIETYKNVQTLLEASTEDIDDMVSRTCDPNTLITYISVMKREMTISLNKRRELRTKVKSLQQALTKATMEKKFLSEEHTKRKKIEEDFMICESEKMALQNKLSDLEKKMRLLKPTGIDFNVENNLDINAEHFSKQNAAKCIIMNKTIDVEDVKDKKKTVAADIANVEKNDSPYLPVRSGGIIGLKEVTTTKRGIMKTSSSMFAKRPRIEKPSVDLITYDGFGGHSKYDQFPGSSDTKIRKNKDDHHKPKV